MVCAKEAFCYLLVQKHYLNYLSVTVTYGFIFSELHKKLETKFWALG